jgi:hypothetical protein
VPADDAELAQGVITFAYPDWISGASEIRRRIDTKADQDFVR